MKKNSEAGVTLVEILIAVSLLSLLSVGLLVAMRLGFNTMDKTDAKLVANRRVANSRQIIENEIHGFMVSVAFFHPRPNQTNATTFLEAQPQRMRFLTSYSINDAWRGRPQIAVIQVIPGERNQGVRLIANETPYTGPEQSGQQITAIDQAGNGDPVVHYMPIDANSQSFVLADRLAYCRFLYLEPKFEPPYQVWRPDWVNPALLPKAVRIEMAPLDNQANDLHISTVTVPLEVTRSPFGNYVD